MFGIAALIHQHKPDDKHEHTTTGHNPARDREKFQARTFAGLNGLSGGQSPPIVKALALGAAERVRGLVDGLLRLVDSFARA